MFAFRAQRHAAGGATPGHAAVRFPPPLIYVLGFLAGLALQWAIPLPALPDALAVALGILGVALGVALSASSTALFRRAGTTVLPFKPTTALVTSGPYRITRNPMYLGLVFLYAGLAVWLEVTWALLLLPLVILVVERAAIVREERYLERTFGDEYRRYKARVRRWL